MKRRSALISSLLAVLLAAPVTAQQAGSYVGTVVDTPSTISGQVTFDGDVPSPLQLLITKDMEICGEGYRERTEIETTEEMGLLRVVVFIEEIQEGKSWSEAEIGTEIDQRNCFFQPYVQVIRRGSEIDIVNSDSTLHNIHAYELIGRVRRSLFNISQPDLGPVRQVISPQRGNRVSLECDSHDFMQSWIFITDNPYATVVDSTGSFEISGIPAGTYTLSAWHPRLGMSTQEVSIEPNTRNQLNFTLRME